ncbi:Pumilio-family RNA binding repeat-containing protein [Besnoitia besnoiti]|uniref:Pumilio-family RNA binding repeat-containing protein n=1 Tax=Besnoitia besnoiti TaxID=94643 RepID=A0A2A9MBM1_BESBE|nr:Pumilio-family RNA binding repeat-containing protein [Besnoitia besnoiti]PFH33316.1 Pumilio-family RNA binding repeat-containing protein [Besnoitia besnoiti]
MNPSGSFEGSSPSAGCREGKKVNFCAVAGNPSVDANAIPSPSVFPSSTLSSPVLSAVAGPAGSSAMPALGTQEVGAGGLDLSSPCGSGSFSSKPSEKRPTFLQPIDGEIPRPTSAPPHLEKSSSTLFAFPPSGSTTNSLIDIRCDELYQEFYRNLSQKNPKLPKPLEEDQSFLDLASQKKGRRQSTRTSGYFAGNNRDIRASSSGGGSGGDGLTCVPPLSSSFSATSRDNLGTAVPQEDEEGTSTASTGLISSTAAAVNAAAALALVDELQHRQEAANLVCSTRALSLAVLAAAGGVAGGATGGSAASSRIGAANGSEETEQHGASLSAAAAAALLQDAHAAWKESGGNAALLPMVQKWTEAILNRCPDAQPGAAGAAGGLARSPSDSFNHALQRRASLTAASPCSSEGAADNAADSSTLRSSERHRSPPSTAASSQNAAGFSFPIQSAVSSTVRGCAGDGAGVERSGRVEVGENGHGRSRSDSHDHAASRNRPNGFSSLDEEGFRRTLQSTMTAPGGVMLASPSDVQALVHHAAAAPSSSHAVVMASGLPAFLTSHGLSPTGADNMTASGGQSVPAGLDDEQVRLVLSAAQQQEQHFLQAVAALRGSQASAPPAGGPLADSESVVPGATAVGPDAAGAGSIAGVLHPALSLGGSLGANPAAAAALLSAMAGVAGASSADGPLALQHLSSPAMGPLGLDSGLAHAANSSAPGSAGHVGTGPLAHAGGSAGDAGSAAMAHALNLAVLGQAFHHRAGDGLGRDSSDGDEGRGQGGLGVPTPGAIAAAAAASEVAGNAQLLSSVLYPLLNAQSLPSLGVLGGTPGSSPAHAAPPPGMVLGPRDPRGSWPCVVGATPSLGGHAMYPGGLQHHRGPLGIGDHALSPAAAALLASAARMSQAPPGLSMSPPHAPIMVPRGLDVHADFLHQQRTAAAVAAHHQTATGSGLHAAAGWPGVDGAAVSTGTASPAAGGSPRPVCVMPTQSLHPIVPDNHLRAATVQAGAAFVNAYLSPDKDSAKHKSSGLRQGPGVKVTSARTRPGRAENRGKADGSGPQRAGGLGGDGADGHASASAKAVVVAGTSARVGGKKGDSPVEGSFGRNLGSVELVEAVAGGGSGNGPSCPGTLTVATAEDLVFGNKYRGNIEMIARDQIGCRMLQRKLSEADAEEVKTICLEVLDCVIVLLVDPFGNYLVQKVVEECAEPQLLQLVRKLRPRIVDVCLSPHGTRAVQKLIEVCAKLPAASPSTTELLAALRPSIVLLAKDANANHVVQKILASFSPARCDFVFAQVKKHCVEISKERHGCCVMQRCIDAAPPQAKTEILQGIAANALELMQDAFGNYVVQYVLDLQLEGFNGAVTEAVRGRIRELSMQKFSSNVVEKCLMLGTAEQRSLIVEELLAEGDGLKDMLLDLYANYVVQRALTVCPPPVQQQLLSAIQPCLSQLRQTQPGTRVAHKLVKKFPSLLVPVSANSVAGGESAAGGCLDLSKKSHRGQARTGTAVKGTVATSATGLQPANRRKKSEKPENGDRKGQAPAALKPRRNRETTRGGKLEAGQFHGRVGHGENGTSDSVGNGDK